MNDDDPPREVRGRLRVSRPTTKAEWTLIGAGVFCGLLALVFTSALVLHTWAVTPANDKDRIHYIGWALFLAIAGLLLVIVAIVSPSVGTVHASGLGAEVELKGRGAE